MISVGLTGSIAVGKTFVCECFRGLGAHVLDADRTAREVVAKGTEGLHEIVGRFGSEVLRADGELDRRRMADIVFADKEAREALNAIVHPRVIARQDQWLRDVEEEDAGAIAIIDAALMIESGSYRRFDKLVVVWCRPDIQLRRLMLRDSLSEADAKKRIDAQMPQEEKKRYADILIDTSEGFDATALEVSRVYSLLRSSQS